MDAQEALLLVMPAMLLLLAAGGLAGFIEKAVYQFARARGLLSEDAGREVRLQSSYGERRTELARLRETRAGLENDIALQMKDRANLQDQERRMADRQANQVAEAGYPAPGLNGYYFRIEGPAAVMPFAGLASQATSMGGRRLIRLVVWAGSLENAQAIAQSWAGDGTRINSVREFSGRLFWHEV